MKQLAKFSSPLHEKTQATPTCLRNDSPSLEESDYTLVDGWTWLEQSKEMRFERPCLLRNCSPVYHAIVHRLAILPG
jgi:hypothetical protein